MNEIDDWDWREFTEEEMEWYRLWFEFLKLSDKKKWSKKVAHYFDTDYFNDESCTFAGWWPDHKYLFRKLKQPTIEVIRSVEDYEDYAALKEDDESLSDIPGTVALFVHMWATKAELLAAFDEILKKYHKGKQGRGRPEFDDMGDVYNLYARPNTDMLKKILAVYRAKSKPENAEMFLWQIEEEASKEFPIIDKTSEFATYNWTLPQSAVTPDIIEKRRKSQCIMVKRYLDCAEEILNNVVEGRFPVYPTTLIKESTD